jgi:hypothetical protein
MTQFDEDDDRRNPDPDEGAEGSSGAKDSPPRKPDADDDSPLGDTDQHSGADA